MSKKYQFTLTRNYVANWGYIEAIRELLQNAYDYGNEDVSFRDDSICISNKDDILDIKTLLLGYGTKSNDRNQIGGFGEGFLLALLVLVRSNYGVTILNGPEVWTPKFEHNEEFNEDLLVVEVLSNKANDYKDLDIIVEGFSEAQLQEIKRVFLGLDGPYNSIKTTYGEILTDPNQKGKMYVDRLPITSDDNFDYGYNFKARYVNLDRDRKQINVYDLKKITAKSILNMEEFDFKLIDDLVEDNRYDVNYISSDDILPDDFVFGYSDYLKDKYDIKDSDVITTTTDSKVISELERRGESVVRVPKRLQADVINTVNTYSATKLEEVNNDIKNKTVLEEAWDNYKYSEYKALREWYLAIVKDDPTDDILAKRFRESKDDFFYILENLEPSKFDHIRDIVERII